MDDAFDDPDYDPFDDEKLGIGGGGGVNNISAIFSTGISIPKFL